MDYQFLVGERFSIEGECFTVEDVRLLDNRVILEASAPSVDSRVFSAEQVIEALVTEEIELFQTGGVLTG